MKIKIGDKNKIKKSSIGHQIETEEHSKKSLYERYPILISVVVSLLVGFVLLFSFWEQIIKWIENFIKQFI